MPKNPNKEPKLVSGQVDSTPRGRQRFAINKSTGLLILGGAMNLGAPLYGGEIGLGIAFAGAGIFGLGVLAKIRNNSQESIRSN